MGWGKIGVLRGKGERGRGKGGKEKGKERGKKGGKEKGRIRGKNKRKEMRGKGNIVCFLIINL